MIKRTTYSNLYLDTDNAVVSFIDDIGREVCVMGVKINQKSNQDVNLCGFFQKLLELNGTKKKTREFLKNHRVYGLRKRFTP